MKSSSRKSPPMQPLAKEPRAGGGYKLGPRSPKPLPPDAVWATARQVRARYGNTSDMWIYRKLKNDPDFPKPFNDGRIMKFSVTELDAYDDLFLKRARREPMPAPTRKPAQDES
jgi:predicted DNA-binding transcriptional regulator AlpA